MRRLGYFVDANLPVLLVVGAVNRDIIAKHRRLEGYSAADYQTLLALLFSRGNRVFVTPNTLTEAPNFLAQHGKPERSLLMTGLRYLIDKSEEIVIASTQAAARACRCQGGRRYDRQQILSWPTGTKGWAIWPRFARLTADLALDLDTVMVDGTLVKVHQHGTGAPKADAVLTPDASRAAEAIGVSREGLTTKIMARDGGQSGAAGRLYADAGQHPRTAFADGQVADCGWGTDTNAAPAPLAKRDIATVISSRANRKVPRRYAPGVYGMRHFVANRFAAIPQGVSGNCNTARQVGIAIRRDA